MPGMPRTVGSRPLASLVLALATGLAVTVLTPGTSYAADVKGQIPNVTISCGALRDEPSQWRLHANGYCNSPQTPWTYSYIPTSSTDVHTATWEIDWTNYDTGGWFEVDAYIPSADAGAKVNYFYQLCGDTSWWLLGSLDQESDTGWYTPATIWLATGQELCGIREQSADTSGTWYMAEDALGLSAG
jgi:hypothetical protein